MVKYGVTGSASHTESVQMRESKDLDILPVRHIVVPTPCVVEIWHFNMTSRKSNHKGWLPNQLPILADA
jgi:hypothetical protein